MADKKKEEMPPKTLEDSDDEDSDESEDLKDKWGWNEDYYRKPLVWER